MMASGSEYNKVPYSRSLERSPAQSRKQSVDPDAEFYPSQKYFIPNSTFPHKNPSFEKMAPGPTVFAHEDDEGDDGQPSLFQLYNKKFRR